MKIRNFIDMARKILDRESAVRERAADEVTDHLSTYSPAQASSLATLLAAAAVLEKENSALEAELHAILELMSTGHVGVNHVAELREIQLEEIPADLREYVNDLLEN
ncbi:hypothetical protein ACFYSH_25720 [Streptomyces sp. NPDC005791]|uniref:hypothetical protein n=1 Tax=Streptomyces sp. NPDC005791 TaxID=3364732 RepID=UPI0036C672CC